jgi:hypothetical protein
MHQPSAQSDHPSDDRTSDPARGRLTNGPDDLVALDRQLAALRERRSGFPDRDRPFVALAEAVVWCAKVPAETVILEASAGPRRAMADVMDAEERLRIDALDAAEAQALNLENGLRLAHAGGAAELALDSRDPAEDRLAGALISILVASDYATVRTEELGDEQYRYYVDVDWPRLELLAERIGLPPLVHLLTDRPPADSL